MSLEDSDVLFIRTNFARYLHTEGRDRKKTHATEGKIPKELVNLKQFLLLQTIKY